ncbi:hypothetical protein [Devosia sediminis]|uniref:Uncharacterized protein n=1 Tax=Devosia sediminis TaxID=2798801 RepID=A0A934MK50_9HYPH|nr:hypothetical protein [Devosia sediminis]MBJ3783166.1 hypothetical protein [Devosia sediminis]
MSRARVAIAHFSDTAAAELARAALLAKGGLPAVLTVDAAADCHFAVALNAPLERMLLDVLLSSQATRVDVHDA